MIAISADGNANKLRCPSPSESDFTLELEEIKVVLSAGSSETYISDDSLYTRNTSATIRYDARVSYVPITGAVTLPLFRSSDQSVAVVSANGNVTTEETGAVDLFCRAFQTTKKVAHNARTQTPVTADVFANYIDGSLGAHTTTSTDSLLSGEDVNLFSSTSPFTRNLRCWAATLDWTGVSPTNSLDPLRRGGTLVSPRHVVWANHFNIPNGTSLTFVDNSNQTVIRTVSNSLQVANSDIRVGVLNEDVSGSISFYSVLPASWRNYLVTVLSTSLPLIAITQQKKVICREMFNIISNGEILAHGIAQKTDRSAYTAPLVVGDSGQPLFMLINNELILLGSHYTSTGIPQLTHYIDEINAAMTTLGGGYQLTTVDLSAFTNFAS
jgi:hypothetical protein